MPDFPVPGWRKLQLVEIAREAGIRVSDLLEMREAGYGPETRLMVDDDFYAFVKRFERFRDETEMVPAPRTPKGARPMVPRPKNSLKDLLVFLDLTPEGDVPSFLIEETLDVFDDALWEGVDLPQNGA